MYDFLTATWRKLSTLENVVCFRITSTVLSGKVEALYEGRASDLFQKGID
jgi:hypothetical protein